MHSLNEGIISTGFNLHLKHIFVLEGQRKFALYCMVLRKALVFHQFLVDGVEFFERSQQFRAPLELDGQSRKKQDIDVCDHITTQVQRI